MLSCLKNSFNKLIRILDIAKKRISVLEDKSTQIIQTNTQQKILALGNYVNYK